MDGWLLVYIVTFTQGREVKGTVADGLEPLTIRGANVVGLSRMPTLRSGPVVYDMVILFLIELRSCNTATRYLWMLSEDGVKSGVICFSF